MEILSSAHIVGTYQNGRSFLYGSSFCTNIRFSFSFLSFFLFFFFSFFLLSLRRATIIIWTTCLVLLLSICVFSLPPATQLSVYIERWTRDLQRTQRSLCVCCAHEGHTGTDEPALKESTRKNGGKVHASSLDRELNLCYVERFTICLMNN